MISTTTSEAARLRALDRYRLLDTPRENDFDEIAEAAAELCETPIAVVNIIGEGRQFFKAEVGLGVRETPLESSFCRQALLQEDFLYVPDTSLDPRFAGNPLVTGDAGLRFYAGALLKTSEGHPIGTVCVLDTKPHELSGRQRKGLMRLARQTMAQIELRRSLREHDEHRLLHERILDSATDFAIVATDPDGRVTRWNTGAERTLGWTEAEMLGEPLHAFFTPEDRAGHRPEIEMALALEDGSAPDERWHLRKDGNRFWASGEMMPLKSDDGRVVGFLKILRDRTEQREAGMALRETEERYRIASRATNDAIWDWNLAANHVLWNEALQTAHGHRLDAVEPTGDWWIAHIHPDDRGRIDASIHAVIDGNGPVWTDEYRFMRSDGSYANILDRGYVIRDGDGSAVRMIGAMLDITERRRAEEHQRLLTGELQHRVKNTLALVQAIASQTLRGSTDVAEMREAFVSRLISLGRAHDILTASSWTEAPISEVVDGALAVHRGASPHRIRASGPSVPLAAKPALSLALALHELATNATKYGALSNDSGAVDLRWHVVHEGDASRFSLTWAEHGGPPILAQPSRRGFGSRLIERSFAAEVGGQVNLTYAPTGLVCQLEAPLDAMQEHREEEAA